MRPRSGEQKRTAPVILTTYQIHRGILYEPLFRYQGTSKIGWARSFDELSDILYINNQTLTEYGQGGFNLPNMRTMVEVKQEPGRSKTADYAIIGLRPPLSK